MSKKSFAVAASILILTAGVAAAPWSTTGNAGTDPSTEFLGTTDNQPLEIRINNRRVLRLEPTNNNYPNVITGYSGNSVSLGCYGATICGGGKHNITENYATIGGGLSNNAGSYSSTVGGGRFNSASGDSASTVSGGTRNTASGKNSVIPGGALNEAKGICSFAAGYRAKAFNDGAFVWGDNTKSDISSSANNQFIARSSGGVYFYTSSDLSSGVFLPIGSSSWQSIGATQEVGCWSLEGNSDTDPASNFLGTTDNKPLEMRVGNHRALLIMPATYETSSTPNIIGGYAGNSSSAAGSVICGGGYNENSNSIGGSFSFIGSGAANSVGAYGVIGGGYKNYNYGWMAAICGGEKNIIKGGDFAFIGGGASNEATDNCATVSGGFWNRATGYRSTIGGGAGNLASGRFSIISGGSGNNLTERCNYSTIGGGLKNKGDYHYVTISGGCNNIALSEGATIGGGGNNIAGSAVTSLSYSPTVAGGMSNKAGGISSAIGGGSNNLASGHFSTISGGGFNKTTNKLAVVGGGDHNQASARWATVSGGYKNKSEGPCTSIGGGANNKASWWYSTVSGGQSNIAQDGGSVGGGYLNNASGVWSTIAGGTENTAGFRASVGGGQNNKANGEYSVVPGGAGNEASGDFSFAAGWNARAKFDGCFVWSDCNTGISLESQHRNQFIVRACGGTTFFSDPNATTGATLPSGSGSWSSVCDREAKENYVKVEGKELLEKVAEIPIQTWNYKTQDDEIRHIGPVAQDFHAAFGVGEDDKHISTVDADGVALAAIQALYKENQELRSQVEDLTKRLEALENASQ